MTLLHVALERVSTVGTAEYARQRSHAEQVARMQQILARQRQELLAETIANCWVALVRLLDRGLEDVIYPTPLVQYAIRQVRDGRRVEVPTFLEEDYEIVDFPAPIGRM